MKIRPVTASDVVGVVDLVTKTLVEFGLDFGAGSPTDEPLRSLPASYDAHGGAFWVVEDRGELVGTCGVFPVEPAVYELRKMYLRPAARGTGIGARLLETAITWARERGAKALVLDTTEAMARAIAFYERKGFVRDDTQRRGSRCSRGYRLAL